MNSRFIKFLGTVLLVVNAGALKLNAESTHWVATWASAQQQPRGAAPARPAAAPGGQSAITVPVTGAPGATVQLGGSSVPSASGTAPAAPRPVAFSGVFSNQTVRMVAKVSLGGRRIRVHLSNAFGAAPLIVGGAHVALRSAESAIVPNSDRALLFNGAASVTIPAAAEMISDPVDLDVPALGELAISVFIPGDSGPASNHSLALHTAYITGGNQLDAPQFADAINAQAWYWISAVDVMAPANAGAIVTFGDSITDGATSTPNTDRSWPSILAARLAANKATANIAVVNEGISGNRVLGDGAGVSALARFDRDVLSQPGVKYLMIMEGINDIGLGAKAGTVSADALINAMKQMTAKAHDHGIKVIGVTLTPYVGASYASDEGEAMRTALNTFIRTSNTFDAFVDFDKVTQDPANPKQFLKVYNNTDHLHPNDAGYKAMADSIDLSIFTK